MNWELMSEFTSSVKGKGILKKSYKMGRVIKINVRRYKNKTMVYWEYITCHGTLKGTD